MRESHGGAVPINWESCWEIFAAGANICWVALIGPYFYPDFVSIAVWWAWGVIDLNLLEGAALWYFSEGSEFAMVV